MKRTITSALVFLLFIQVKSQITITASAMPVAADTIRYSTASPVGVALNINQKGASQSWDYSGLTSNGQGIDDYIASNKSPYAFYFSNKIGLKTADSIGASIVTFKNIYSFYTKNTSVFRAEGIGYTIQGFPLASMYSDDDEIYSFPLDYGDSDVSTFHFKFTIPTQTSFAFVQAGTRTNIVDGWGSIKTPYKTYASTLRVKTIVDEVDTVITQFAKIPVPRKQVIYKWLSLSEHMPVLEITGTEVGSNFTATQIRFRDKYNGLQSPFAPRAGFGINKTSGVVNTDTFNLTNKSMLATSVLWQITPANSSAKFVSATTANSQNPRVVFTKAGLYSVTLIASNSFGSDDTSANDLIEITDPNNSSKALTPEGMVLYPNPTSSFLFIKSIWPVLSVEVESIDGKLVAGALSNTTDGIDLSQYPRGMYLVKVNHIHGTSAFLVTKE